MERTHCELEPVGKVAETGVLDLSGVNMVREARSVLSYPGCGRWRRGANEMVRRSLRTCTSKTVLDSFPPALLAHLSSDQIRYQPAPIQRAQGRPRDHGQRV